MKSKIYEVQMWSDNRRHDAWGGGESHYTDSVHRTSTLEKAKKWCNSHLDYGGNPGMDDYFPWHFQIYEQVLDEDHCCVVGPEGDNFIEEVYPEWDEEKSEEEEEIPSFLDKLPVLLRDIAEVIENHFGK